MPWVPLTWREERVVSAVGWCDGGVKRTMVIVFVGWLVER